MSRALRYAPPLGQRELIDRPRLLSRLGGRFDRRLTAVVAAPGGGKTTLLAQAVRENALSPLGQDRWLTCQRDDVALSFLASGVFTVVGLTSPVPEDPREAAVAVAQAIWSEAPRHVALILDDVHFVTPGSPSSAFLSELVEELPRNGHIVLASRPPLPLGISRLEASGDAKVLRNRDMPFLGEELEAFAASRKVPAEVLSSVDGWPACAELRASVGPHAVTEYMKELLHQLSPERREVLAVLIAVGGADDEIATALLGRDVNLGELLDCLPLVVEAGSGWWSVHEEWSRSLQHELDTGRTAEVRRTAGVILRRRQQYHEAMDLLINAEAWDDVRDLIRHVCEVCTPLVPPDVLQVWLRRLPSEVRDCPEGLLLAAMAVEPSYPQAAEQLLEKALAMEEGVAVLRYACLNALVQLAFWRADRRRMKLLLDQLGELAQRGHATAPGWIPLLRALLAPTAEQIRAELSAPMLASGEPLNPVQDWLHAHIVLLKLGDAAAAEPLARRALEHSAPTMHAVSRCALLESYRLRGRLDVAETMLPALLADMNPGKVTTSPEVVTCAVVLLDVLGRHDQATELSATFEPAVRSSPVAWAPIAAALTDAFHQVSVGDEQNAVAALGPILDLPVVRNQTVVQISPVALPLLYVLVPEARAQWDALPPPGCFGELLELVRALVELREQARLTSVTALSPRARTILRAALPLPWVTELAVALIAAGRKDARSLLEEVGSRTRPTLRTLSRAANRSVAATARTLLRELPTAPDRQLELRVLGTTELRRDGAVVNAPELRRERVRQLLGYMISHDRPTRTAIMAELWPDRDEVAANRNLRVTLAYLQKVLEPERDEQDSPYFIRSSGAVLYLVTEGLDVDVLEFERCLDEAARLERQGALSGALSAYERATDLWNGDYLADVAHGDWLESERERLRGRFVRAAVRAGNLLLARGDPDRARTLGERARRADPWCEDVHQLLVAVHLDTGDLVSAQRCLRRCYEMLGDLGVPAGQRTRTLARQLQERR
jgi:LuxR family maltose regulon positive regulatory protein